MMFAFKRISEFTTISPFTVRSLPTVVSPLNITFKKGFVIDDTKIKEEILELTDWFTDDLFYSKEDTQIIAPFSGVFCDVERFSDDSQEEMFKLGTGVL